MHRNNSSKASPEEGRAEDGIAVPVSPWFIIIGINSTLITVQTAAAILFSLPLILPPASYIGPQKAVEEEYICVLSTLGVFNKASGLSPENQSFKVVRDTESDFRATGTALANGK